MKKFFKYLSGRPKSGDIVECFKPFICIPILIIAIWLMYMAVSKGWFIYGIASMMFCWQLGWGMSIERFNNNLEEDK